MADLAALNIEIGADLTKLEQAVPKFNSSVEAMSRSVQKTNAVLDQNAKNLAKVGAASSSFSGGMAKVPNATNAATLALGNFGRVLQDAPYGFIGISNNLNPLVESFQRLGAQAKATGTSVGSVLLKSLTGAGGLGFAFSAVTAAIGFAQLGLSLWTRGMGSAKEATDELRDALSKAEASFDTDLVKINSLVKVAKDYSQSQATRTNALKELQKEYPGYLSNLNLENINSQEATNAINNLTDALIRKAQVQAYSNLLTKAQEDLIKAQNSKILENANVWDKLVSSIKGAVNPAAGLSELATRAADAQSQSVGELQSSVAKYSQVLSDLFREQSRKGDFEALDPAKAKKQKEAIDQISKALFELKNNLRIIDLTEGGDPIKKYDAIYDTIKKLLDLKVPENGTIIQKLLGDANQLKIDNLATFTKKFGEEINRSVKLPNAPIDIKINPVLDKDQLEEFIKKAKIEAAASDLSIELPINFNSLSGNELDLLIGPLKEVDKINEKIKLEFGEDLPESLKKFYKALKDLEGGKQQLYDIEGFAQNIEEEYGGKIPDAYGKYIDAAEKANKAGDFKGAQKFIDRARELKSSLDELKESIKDVLSTSLTDFFVGIGESVAGVTNPFKAFGQIVSEGLKSMGKALIQYGIEVGIIQKVFANPLNPISPALAAAAGIALIALSSIVKKDLGFTKMATGGIIPPGFEGDRFPAFLNSGEAVIPLDKLQQYIAPVSGNVVVYPPDVILRGADIYLSYKRQERKNGRIY